MRSLSPTNPRRKRVDAWIESNRVQGLIVFLILLNAFILGLETFESITAGFDRFLHALDTVILGIFVVEITLKLYARRLDFFREPWNIFDFVIIGIALIPTTSGQFAVMRTLRILRVLRLISMVPRLRFVVESLVRAIPGISSTVLLMLIIFYVFGVVATDLFGGRFPQWFSTVPGSMYTLFQIMTLESWSMGIVRPVMVEYPYAWVFFIPFILITTFAILNLLIGIIVDAMQSMHGMEHDQDQVAQGGRENTSSIEEEVRGLREELRAVRRLLSDADRREKGS